MEFIYNAFAGLYGQIKTELFTFGEILPSLVPVGVVVVSAMIELFWSKTMRDRIKIYDYFHKKCIQPEEKNRLYGIGNISEMDAVVIIPIQEELFYYCGSNKILTFVSIYNQIMYPRVNLWNKYLDQVLIMFSLCSLFIKKNFLFTVCQLFVSNIAFCVAHSPDDTICRYLENISTRGLFRPVCYSVGEMYGFQYSCMLHIVRNMFSEFYFNYF